MGLLADYHTGKFLPGAYREWLLESLFSFHERPESYPNAAKASFSLLSCFPWISSADFLDQAIGLFGVMDLAFHIVCGSIGQLFHAKCCCSEVFKRA